ncbi:transcriptional regulator [Candidatus Odyssella acanthamoebae]|uniref:transcriptional regulator n=1 Tax=Candidatus Odyssella acanthamoebae TaxID=91604 RepID=UPI00068A57CE|nr:YdaS family helix-turn-helix protein [Candidatus Paracaedibacter acanthamoebae]
MTAKPKFNIDEVKRAIEIVGSANKLAVEIKVSSLTAYRWRDGKSVPSPENCLKIERITRGKVLAKDIRPDLDWERILEELRNIV